MGLTLTAAILSSFAPDVDRVRHSGDPIRWPEIHERGCERHAPALREPPDAVAGAQIRMPAALYDTLADWWRGRVTEGEPGGVLLVRSAGRELVASARGVADLETGRTLDCGTPFYLASVAKPVTAGIVRRLAERGALRLDDDIVADLPELPHLAGVRVRHLLDHTAGVPDYFRWIDWPKFREIDDEAVLDSLANHPQMNARPGVKFAYSNSHYVLLSVLVRRRTGSTLREHIDREFAGALRLTSFYVDDTHEPLPSEAAEAYVRDPEGFRLASYERFDLPGPAPVVPMRFATTGAGGLFANAPDLARWAEAEIEHLPVILPSDVVPVADGDSRFGVLHGYRLGWFVSELHGKTVYWHSGNRGGFGSIVVVAPLDRLVLAFLTNRGDIEPEDVAARVLTLLIPGRGTSPPSE